MSIIWRLVRAGLVAALLVGVAGWTAERVRFGASDDDALARVEHELRQHVDESADTLGDVASRVAAQRDLVRAAPRDSAAGRRLFDLVASALPGQQAGRTGITVYDAVGAPIAWAGRVDDLARDRVNGPSALFVAPTALGPTLVRIEPLTSLDRVPTRLGTIVVEQLLGQTRGGPSLGDTFIVPTSIVPVSVHARVAALPAIALEPHEPDARPGDRRREADRSTQADARTTRNPYSFVVPSRGGGVLVDAEVVPADLAAARARWHNGTMAAVGSVLAVTLLLCGGPLVEVRRRTRERRTFVVATAGVAVVVIAARAAFWLATARVVGTASLTSPLDLLLNALAGTALVWLALDLIERRRVSAPRPRLLGPGSAALVRLVSLYGAAGAFDGAILWAYVRFLQRFVSETSLDLLHFSLHPLNAARLGVAFGLVLLHAAVIWTAAAIIRLAAVGARAPRQPPLRRAAAAAWLGGVALVLLIAPRVARPVPVLPWLAAVAAAGACACALARIRRHDRRASQAGRLMALFVALLAPALAMYPSLLALASNAKERLVSAEFAPEAANLREELQYRLRTALKQIDTQPSLPDFVIGSGEETTPTSDRASVVWSQTDLAMYRLTSAVELYGADGRLVSRFALNLPDYTTARHLATTCEWEIFDEASPFGSNDPPVLRASRAICDHGTRVGSIIVRVELDYRTLPFISSQSPYLESLRPDRQVPIETAPERDVEFVLYGWSRAPLYESGTSVWALPDPVFERMVRSREPFWTTLTRNGEDFRVFFMNDRSGIYALGYPVIEWVGHFINLAELATLTGALYVLLLGGATLFNALTSRTPASGRALLREIRSSFYRKLFLAFVLAAGVPVVILAIGTRAYFAAEFRLGIDDAAVKTATVAQRLVEDYAMLQQRGPAALGALDDQIMVLVSRAIDQDVNLFDRARLLATSQRDLFASQLLSTRTPGDVYRVILIDRLPTFVGVEEVGDFKYLLAAAPVRTGGREAIVTVPLTLRQQEIEQQIDELDRQVLSAAVLFALLSAAVGYWMAERIADPVNRLTRATRRIARGDLDAHIASTSADELGRLVSDFNGMADDLKRQRAELERTQRLEAWADMARQVAHDIKNPLTPIQLSAEHARRVNIDRGRPLSPVLDDCVNTILSQVRLLRQISAEFSSFASAPTPRPEPTDVAALLEEVVAPYRTSLAGRIDLALDAPADLPRVSLDRTLFSRALTNVVENALHAMPGQGTLAVRARMDVVGGRPAIVVTVADTGVGMDADALNKIFEPYFSTKATGTGLGLTIAKRNVELNGGTIAVESARGAGTTVTVTVPIERD